MVAEASQADNGHDGMGGAAAQMPGTAPGETDQQIEDQLSTEIDQQFMTRLANELLGHTGTGSSESGGGAGSGYEVSPDQLQGWINRWQNVIDETSADRRGLQAMMNVQAPAPDQDASEFHASATRKSGKAALKHNAAMLDYATSQLAKLKAAHQGYIAAEQANQAAFNRQDGT